MRKGMLQWDLNATFFQIPPSPPPDVPYLVLRLFISSPVPPLPLFPSSLPSFLPLLPCPPTPFPSSLP